MPVAFDQPDNARRTMTLGIARSIPFARATAAAMARELQSLLGAEAVTTRAGALGAMIAREDGARAAADALEEIFRN